MDRSVENLGQVAGTTAPVDMSLMGMFFGSDILSQFIMVGLLVASVWCWAIIFNKQMKLRAANKQADLFEETFWSGGSIEALYDRVSKRTRDAMTATFVAGMGEWRLAREKAQQAGMTGMGASLKERVERRMAVTIGREMSQLERYMTFLSSLASAGPLLGLFGTVWGIMASFAAIGASQSSSLAVVAPGLAEALLTTAVGLIAAIPAALAYNKYSTSIARYGERLDAFSAEFANILSRYLDEKN